MRATLLNAALVIFSSVIGFGIVELGVRIYMPAKANYRSGEFRALAAPYGDYDGRLGVAYAPDTSAAPVVIKGGTIEACLGPISATNKDGLRGRTTLAEYDRARVKVVVVGDSFSHWRQEGMTWPDLLQEDLRAHGLDVAVLNLAAGGYGILQMVDAAVIAVEKYHPDVVILAFITDDLARARWWQRNEVVGGMPRLLLSPDRKDFSLAVARDMFVINPVATDDWCRRYVGRSDAPGLAEIISQHGRIVESLRAARGLPTSSPWDFSRSMVIDTIWPSHLDPKKDREEIMYTVPQVRFKSFQQDAAFLEEVAQLRRSGTRLMLVHLPYEHELKQTHLILRVKDKSLWDSLVEAFGQPVIRLGDGVAKRQIPSRMNLLPLEGHPSIEGLRFYADHLAARMLPVIAAHSAGNFRR